MPVDFHVLWEYREILYGFVSRNVKVRYMQTAFIFLWAIIQLLFMMVIFTLFFEGFAKIPSDGVPYPLFRYAALLPWTLFAEGFTRSTTNMVSNTGIMTKVYFPRLVMPIYGILSSNSSSVICYTSRDGSVLRGWRHAIEIGISPTR